MSTPSEAARAIVYGHLDGVGRSRARRELCSDRAPAFLSGAARECLPRVRALGLGAAGDCALVTVLLHYALGAAAVPSHRKVSVRGAEVDIAIPDARTLASSPRRALVICVPEDASARGVEAAVAAASAILPRENVMAAICPSAAGARDWVHSVEDGTLGGVIARARAFLASTGGGRLGVLASPAGPEQLGGARR